MLHPSHMGKHPKHYGVSHIPNGSILGPYCHMAPFFHQMGPYQTLRAHTSGTQVWCVSAYFLISEIMKITKTGPKIPGTCYSGKKGPCQQCPGTRPNGFSPPKSTNPPNLKIPNPDICNPGCKIHGIPRYPWDVTP